MHLLVVFALAAFWSATLAQDPVCGTKPPQDPWVPFIIEGRDAKPGSWPWQISLHFSRDDTFTNFYHTCGAVLIDEWWALTAGHCTDPFVGGENRTYPHFYRLLLGAHNISDTNSVTQIIEPDLILPHPKYDAAPTLGYPNDITMVRFSEKADLSQSNVVPACVPPTQDFDFTDNENCWITGWGLTDWENDDVPDILQEAAVHIWSNSECQANHIAYIRDTHICAGTGLPNACSGDSGGPMACLVDGSWYVAGTASFGVVGCRGIPTVYTRVSKYWEWIAWVMASYPPPGAN